MVQHIDTLFPALQRTLSDEADEVVQQCLVVLAEVISSPVQELNISPYYNKFFISLLRSFRDDRKLLQERGSFIIRYLRVIALRYKTYLLFFKATMHFIECKRCLYNFSRDFAAREGLKVC